MTLASSTQLSACISACNSVHLQNDGENKNFGPRLRSQATQLSSPNHSSSKNNQKNVNMEKLSFSSTIRSITEIQLEVVLPEPKEDEDQHYFPK